MRQRRAKSEARKPNSTEQTARSSVHRPAEFKRLTIDVSLALHTRIKTQCAARQVKMVDELRRLLEREFGSS